jgi:hypothetical protein
MNKNRLYCRSFIEDLKFTSKKDAVPYSLTCFAIARQPTHNS